MRLSRIAMLLAASLSAVAVAARAQSMARDPAWFGVPLPAGLSDPHRAVVNVASVTPKPAVVPPGEERFSDLQGAAIHRDLERIVGFSKDNQASGEKAWGRITGFAGAENAYNWAAEQFKKAGLQNVEVQRYDGTGSMWYAKSWEVRVLADPAFGAGSQPVVLASAIPTSGSQIPGGTLTAMLVNIGSVQSTTAVPSDMKDTVAVQDLTPPSGAYAERTRTSARARAAAAKGARAVINIVRQTGNMHLRDFGNCDAPCFNIGESDGAFLEAVMQKAADAHTAVRIQISLRAENRTGLKGQNVIGLVPGRTTDENIIVNAHGDGWFDAAGDNGDGFASVLALAKHFARPENKPERTLVFVISGGHHSSGLNGPSNLVRMNAELVKKTVLVVNLEHVAQLYLRPGPWRAEATEQPMSLGISNQAPFLMALGKRAMDRYGFQLNPTFGSGVPGDLGGYEPLHVARVQAIHSGPMYHTSGDTLDTISVPGLERAARFFAYFVAEAAKAPRRDLNPQ